MIVDTHAHYSEPHSAARPYLATGHAGDLERKSSKPLLVEDLIAESSKAGIDKLVQVTQKKMGFDNRYSIEGALKNPTKILGVIGRFDPIGPDVEDRLASYFEDPVMLGARLTLLTPETAISLRDGSLAPFFEAAQKIGVPVQIYAPFQAEALGATAREYPDLRFIVDHMGLANDHLQSGFDVFAEWPKVLKLAKHSNVWLKVSFFPEATGGIEDYPFSHAQYRFRQLYETVGSGRLIWGSNYPPVTRVCSYSQALEFVRKECNFLTEKDREEILGDNFVASFSRPRINNPMAVYRRSHSP